MSRIKVAVYTELVPESYQQKADVGVTLRAKKSDMWMAELIRGNIEESDSFDIVSEVDNV